jgi:hypothetical protein
VDLSPPGATDSIAYGIAGAMQVGYATFGDGTTLAGSWSGTAASWQALPFPIEEEVPFTAYHPNVGTSIWTDGARLCASGHLARAGYVSTLYNDTAILWSRPLPAPCYPNCDGSTAAPALNIADFSCFLTRFASGDAYANCDGSTTPPVLNVLDFSCFLQKFAAGCP